ncbi:MAG TPA: hypothetical protein VGU25_06800 [Acidobacteriaceae bacterium]|nr:hypothetical protein [Acidobacteriaceae bacterium]
MRKLSSALVRSLFCALLTPTLISTAGFAQTACSNMNRGPGEGKFTGQISSVPDGSTLQISYGTQTVTVRYSNSVTVCQGGQPASVSALVRGASATVYGALHGMEIDAARIFVAGPPRGPGMNREPAANATEPAPGNVSPAPQARTPNPAPIVRPNPGTPPEAGATPQPNVRQAPARAMNVGRVPNSVVLTGGTHAQTMQRLHVVRTYALESLRSNSQVTLGEAKVDFQPMLSNPQALFNVADRLRAMPQHVEVRENTSEISEVDQGLVIHHVLTYRILPGKCADASAKAQLARAGVACFTRSTTNERLTEFGTRGSPRYVADPGKRQAAAAAYQRNIALEQADANKGIAQLKSALANPTQRAAIVAQVGEAEAARMATLTDDDLKGELINSGVQQFEEVMFVPNAASSKYAHPKETVLATGTAGEMNATQQLLRNGVPANGSVPNFPKLLRVVPAHSVSAGAGADKAGDADLGTDYFLTGFTIGNDYEWSWGEQVTINWCIVGCSSTYGLELHAGFNYGFGLRFPIQMDLKYHGAVNAQNSATGTVTANFVPIEGNVNDFAATGLSQGQMFDAKEIVAQIGFDAGFDLNLPGLSVDPGFSLGVDFTDYLPAPFTGGKFQPPAPGSGGINSVLILNGLDLLGGLLNYGVAGGQLLPAAKLNLHSDKLQFTFHDETQNRQTVLTHSPQTISVGVSAAGGTDNSHFSVGNPVYNLGFTVTPGINPQVFVDIDVWSDQWNWQIWFPQLSLSLPPNGIDFGCHDGTTCVLDFQTTYNPGTGQVSGQGQNVTRERQVAYNTLTQGGCTADSEQQSDFLCPLNGMYGLCETMLKNGAVASCGALVPAVVDHILRNGHCTGSGGNYSCPNKGMVGLCETYVKNKEVLSCKQSP